MPLSDPYEPAPPASRRRLRRRGDDESDAYAEFWGREAAERRSAASPPTAAHPTAPYEPETYDDESYAAETYDEYYEEDYEAYAAAPQEDLSRRRGCRAVLLAFGLLVVGAGIAGWLGWSWVQRQIDPAGEPGDTVVVEIPEGSSTSDVGHQLADAGVIRNATVWDWYIRVRDPGEFQAGSYEMQLNSSFDEAIDALEEGALPPNAVLVTVPEGLTVDQTVARLADPENGVERFTAERLREVLQAPESRSAYLPEGQQLLEGTLFPESYQVGQDDTEADVVQRMVAELDNTLADLDIQARSEALGLSPYEVLIVASLIEEEGRVDEDRPQIARVIYNRLAEPMALQIDATSCYPRGEPGCTPTQEDLESDSPYNTRNRPGLPPTPIASPGRASIEAALAPADGDWLYYVLDADADDGSHVFTADYDEFLDARNRCREADLGCG
ncbi:MAG TPA: endolytic transglycosylase MltG [Acidimicrobiales bacterium]|jgi:UPF0755 protein|nr:endolytic transglycosylase MltG [Acidimicrobiales bacterium]